MGAHTYVRVYAKSRAILTPDVENAANKNTKRKWKKFIGGVANRDILVLVILFPY